MKCIKKSICITLVVCMLFSLCVSAYAGNGDINADGELSGDDVKLMLKIASGQIEATQEQYQTADYNNDGVVNSADVIEASVKCDDLYPKDAHLPFEQISPYEKQKSSEKATFCKVKTYVAEIGLGTTTNSNSAPTCSASPNGTFDYISAGPYSESGTGKQYYKLKSGKKIYKKEVSVFTGYKMPLNNIHLSRRVNYNQSSTDIYLALDWRVPFNVNVKPQEYEKGYNGKVYNVKNGDFTATYVDVTFYYTGSVKNTLTFPESDTIKFCKWILNEDKNTATLRLYLREKGKFYGFKATYDENNYLVLSIKEPVNTLDGRVIMIDPGHGGNQPGAVSYNGYDEENITWSIALKLKKLLENEGATVLLSRGNTSDEPTIQERRINTFKKNPDLFVSIHTDSSDSTGAKGCSVYYYKNYSAPLSAAICEELPKATQSMAGYTLKNRGSHYYAFHVARVDNCPAVLVECGFISNKAEFNMMKSANGQNAIAKGLYNGIIKYFDI